MLTFQSMNTYTPNRNGTNISTLIDNPTYISLIFFTLKGTVLLLDTFIANKF